MVLPAVSELKMISPRMLRVAPPLPVPERAVADASFSVDFSVA
jgi:hypothetical protein